jgi:hypothetical protein
MHGFVIVPPSANTHKKKAGHEPARRKFSTLKRLDHPTAKSSA